MLEKEIDINAREKTHIEREIEIPIDGGKRKKMDHSSTETVNNVFSVMSMCFVKL